MLVIVATLIGAGGALLFKLSSEKLRLNIRNILKNYKMLAGFSLYFLSAIIFIIALQGGNVNVLYPITSASYVWVTILSKKYLKEKINFYKIVGILLILFGIVTITS